VQVLNGKKQHALHVPRTMERHVYATLPLARLQPKRKKEEDTMANRNQHYQIMKPISEHASFQQWCKDHNQRVKKKAGLTYHDKKPWVRT
jgi:hypothetical protein